MQAFGETTHRVLGVSIWVDKRWLRDCFYLERGKKTR